MWSVECEALLYHGAYGYDLTFTLVILQHMQRERCLHHLPSHHGMNSLLVFLTRPQERLEMSLGFRLLQQSTFFLGTLVR